MNKSDRVFSVICLGISLWLILESTKYNYTVKYTPGPVPPPFWMIARNLKKNVQIS